MANGGNLPKLIKYENNIKDVTIAKFAGNNAGEFGDCYFIKFTEIIESEKEQHKFLWIKEKIKVQNEQEHILPFTFKSYEIAKDFAQYLPNMSIKGERLYDRFEKNKMALYETYQLQINGISIAVYLKFIPNCEHPTTNLRKRKSEDGEYKEFYINDLDKKFFDDTQGNWYKSEELIVDGFFTAFNLEISNNSIAKIIPKTLFEKISDIKQIESDNTHKFILVEND